MATGTCKTAHMKKVKVPQSRPEGIKTRPVHLNRHLLPPKPCWRHVKSVAYIVSSNEEAEGETKASQLGPAKAKESKASPSQPALVRKEKAVFDEEAGGGEKGRSKSTATSKGKQGWFKSIGTGTSNKEGPFWL